MCTDEAYFSYFSRRGPQEFKNRARSARIRGSGAKPPVGSGAEPLYVRSRSFGRFVPFVVFESCVLLF
jgi:hypothetical protein